LPLSSELCSLQSDEELPVTLIVCEKFPAQSSYARSQIWAVKQESLVIPGQWKHTQVCAKATSRNAFVLAAGT